MGDLPLKKCGGVASQENKTESVLFVLKRTKNRFYSLLVERRAVLFLKKAHGS